MSNTVGIAELRHNPGVYLRRVEGGERLIVTEPLTLSSDPHALIRALEEVAASAGWLSVPPQARGHAAIAPAQGSRST